MFARSKATAKQAKEAVPAAAGAIAGNGAISRADQVATGLLIVGVLNWLSVSLLNFDLVQALAGRGSKWGRLAYGALGASAVYATARGARALGDSRAGSNHASRGR